MKKIFLIFLIIFLILPSLSYASELFNYYNTGDDSSSNCYDNSWIAQSFTASKNYEISSIRLKVWKLGTPEGEYLYLSIRKVEGGLPVGSDLTTGSIATADLYIGATGRWEEISLTPYRLEEGQEYAIIMWGDGHNLNDFRWRRDVESTYYGTYFESSDSGSSWTGYYTLDLMFETYGTEYTPPMIPVEEDFVINALAYVGDVWTDFHLIAILGMGLPISFYIIKKVITLF